MIPKYKIFISKADGAAGQIGNPIPAKILGKAEFGDINEICTTIEEENQEYKCIINYFRKKAKGE